MTPLRPDRPASGPTATAPGPGRPRPRKPGAGPASAVLGPAPAVAGAGDGAESAAGQDSGAAGAVAAGVTAVLAALFGDWGAWSSPLGAGASWFPLPWGVTAGPPVLLLTLAGVLIARPAPPPSPVPGPIRPPDSPPPPACWYWCWNPSGRRRSGTRSPRPRTPVSSGSRSAGCPPIATLALAGRRPRRSTGLAPYVWLTLLGAVVPLVALTAGLAGASPVHGAVCTATECISPRAGLLFTGELSLRLALPAWAASAAVLALARRSHRVRRLRGGWQVLLALGAGGLAVLFSPGLVFGASV